MTNTQKPTDDMEHRIIESATTLFLENGFVETSMGDIAARVGVNRPAINYYFRTKERLFEEVLGSIVRTIMPRVVGVVMQQDLSVAERIERLVDIYYGVFLDRPTLPFFMLREFNRNPTLILNAMERLGMLGNIAKVRVALESEMQAGRLRKVPTRIVLFTLVSQLTMPFSARPLVEAALLGPGEPFTKFLEECKPNVIRTMVYMLTPDPINEQ